MSITAPVPRGRLARGTATLIAVTLATAGLTTISAVTAAPKAHATTAVGKGSQCTDTSSVGGSIQRCQILKRAQLWVDNAVPYDQNSTAADPQGTNYRTDCSGYVAMAWHLPKVDNGTADRIVSDPAYKEEINTGLSTDVVTNVDATSNGYSNKSQLQPGDAMEIVGQHALIFNGWTDSTMTKYYAYEESNESDRTHQDDGETPYLTKNSSGAWVSTVQNPVSYPYWSGIFSSSQQYIAVRYNNVSDIQLAVTLNGVQSGASYSGSIALSATPNEAVDGMYYHIQQGGVDKLVSPEILGGSPYNYAADISGLPNGQYSVTADAVLGGQIVSSTATTITVNNFQPQGHGGLAPLANGAFEKSFRSSDGNLWLATGSGNLISAAADPLALGVSAGTTPSTATLSDGSSVTAFNGNDGYLWIATGNGAGITASGKPGLLGVAPGTSPSIVALPGGGWEVAFTAADGTLWLATGSGISLGAATNSMKLGVNPGSSPSLAALPNGNFEVAFKAKDNTLWLATGSGTTITADGNPLALGVQGTTTPSVTALPNGNYAVAFTATDGTLWLATGSGALIASATNSQRLGVAAGTSPSLAALSNGGFEVAFSAADGTLWLGTGSGTTINTATNSQRLGVAGGASPDLVTLSNGNFEATFKATDGSLWLATGSGINITADGNPLALGVA